VTLVVQEPHHPHEVLAAQLQPTRHGARLLPVELPHDAAVVDHEQWPAGDDGLAPHEVGQVAHVGALELHARLDGYELRRARKTEDQDVRAGRCLVVCSMGVRSGRAGRWSPTSLILLPV